MMRGDWLAVMSRPGESGVINGSRPAESSAMVPGERLRYRGAETERSREMRSWRSKARPVRWRPRARCRSDTFVPSWSFVTLQHAKRGRSNGEEKVDGRGSV